jgi:rhodanese-related sulfurtransferase
MSIRTITATALNDLRTSGKCVDLIDVRTPVEFREIHVEGARLVPLDRLDPQAVMADRNGNTQEPLYVICRSGSRARQACERFVAAGFTNVVCVEGGTLACEQAGLPVQRGKKAVSLERQARIVIGSLVVLGAVLALTVHPWFAAFCGLVGAGLVYAGITDTCAVALLLARMPWNQDKEPAATCGTR